MTAFQSKTMQLLRGAQGAPAPAFKSRTMQLLAAAKAKPQGETFTGASGKQITADLEPVPGTDTPEPITPFESAVVGAGQGATAGFGDEALAAMESVSGGRPYGEGRDANRRAVAEYQAANPKSYLGANVLTGAATAALMGAPAGVGRMVALNAAQGGAVGLGESEADLTNGEYGQAALDTGIGATVGGVTSAGLHALSKAAAPFRNTSRAVLSPVARHETGAAAQEGLELAADTGVPLGAAEISGSRTLKKLGGYLRQAPATADEMAAKDISKAGKLHQAVKDVLEKSSGPEVSANEATKKVLTVKRAHDAELLASRASEAKANYAAVDRAAGGRPVVELKETLAAVDRLIQENEGRGKAILTLKRIRDNLTTDAPDRSTLTRFQNLRSDFGEQAQFAKKPKARRIAAALFGAMSDDMDNAAAAADAGASGFATIDAANQQSSEVGRLWRKANDSYRAASQRIKDSENELLTRALKAEAKKGEAELLPKRLLSQSYGDEQVKKTMGVVASINPEAAKGLRRAALEGMLESAAPKAGGAMATAGVELSPAKFASLAQKNAKRIEALFHDDPAALSAWQKTVKVAQRLADQAGTGEGNSQTAAMGWFADIMKLPQFWGAVAGGAYGGDDSRLAGAVTGAAFGYLVKRFTGKALVRILTDPEEAKLLLGIIQPKPGTTNQQLSRMVTQLATSMDNEENQE